MSDLIDKVRAAQIQAGENAVCEHLAKFENQQLIKRIAELEAEKQNLNNCLDECRAELGAYKAAECNDPHAWPLVVKLKAERDAALERERVLNAEMTPEEYRIMLDLLMYSDPWPMETGNQVLTQFADRIAQRYGHENWIEAYHRFTPDSQMKPSEQVSYELDGEPCSLRKLVKAEPEWAVSRINYSVNRIAELEAKLAACRDDNMQRVMSERDAALKDYSRCRDILRTAERDYKARLDAVMKRKKVLQLGINAVSDLIANSDGVVGIHLNGNIVQWEDLLEGGRFESWLREFSSAMEIK